MSKRKWATAAAVGFLAVLLPQAARAQFYQQPATSPFYRPPISPYLNLARGGNPGVNYYGLVRPQVQVAGSLQSLQQQVQTGQASLAAESAALPDTGHPVRFLNNSHYFFNLGGGAYNNAGQTGGYPGNGNPYGGLGLGVGTPLGTGPNRIGMAAQGPRPLR